MKAVAAITGYLCCQLKERGMFGKGDVRTISVEVAQTERVWVISASADALARLSAL
jgi:hypothetical protein